MQLPWARRECASQNRQNRLYYISKSEDSPSHWLGKWHAQAGDSSKQSAKYPKAMLPIGAGALAAYGAFRLRAARVEPRDRDADRQRYPSAKRNGSRRHRHALALADQYRERIAQPIRDAQRHRITNGDSDCHPLRHRQLGAAHQYPPRTGHQLPCDRVALAGQRR